MIEIKALNIGEIAKSLPLKKTVEQAFELEQNVFKTVLDKAVDSLNKVSADQLKADALIKDYIDGKASLESVMIEMEKAGLSMSLAMTVINTTTQTVKEIMQMPI